MPSTANISLATESSCKDFRFSDAVPQVLVQTPEILGYLQLKDLGVRAKRPSSWTLSQTEISVLQVTTSRCFSWGGTLVLLYCYKQGPFIFLGNVD